MIYFVTQKTSHEVVEVPGELMIKNSLAPSEIDWLRSLKILGVDTETNDLDPFVGSILLLILGNNVDQYVIDATSVDCEDLLLKLINHNPEEHPELSPIKNMKAYRRLYQTVIGANMKFDFKFIKVKWNIELMKMFDVMIAEQRLLQGMTEYSEKLFKRIQPSFALVDIVFRRLGIVPKAMDKKIRDEFIGVNPGTFKFKNKHIYYAAGDIQSLYDVREIQKKEIAQMGIQYLIYNIEFPLIRVLGNAELNGLSINEERWRENIKKNKEGKFQTEVALDKEMRRLRDTLLNEEEKKWLSTGHFDRERVKPVEVVQDTLFGEAFEEIEINPTGKAKKPGKVQSPYINWGSGPQVLNIMGRLKLPVPTHIASSKAPGEPEVPTFSIVKGKAKVNKPWDENYSFTMNADALEAYKIENPDSPAKEFVTHIAKYKEYVNRLGTFGEEFLRKYKNRVSKLYHTIYRQCQALTSRLQSGDEDNGWYNSQNIPAEKDYREPFHDNGNWLFTTDLSGAEAVIMIDKARDEKFYQMAIVNDDAHSPLAQAVWRAVGNYRLQKYLNGGATMMQKVLAGEHLNPKTEEEEEKEYQDALALANIVISKKENKQKRTDFKPHTFGDIYGMGDKKRAKVLNISLEEAFIAGKVQKAMIPKTYAMVTANARFAVANGYIILNHRTNSRMWYSEVLEAWKNKSDLPGSVKHEIESSAKNSPIQGTQADMVKEIMVEIDKEADRQDLDVIWAMKLFLQVHDETVYGADKSLKLEDKVAEFVSDKGTVEMVTMGDFIRGWHTQVCNRYLSFITMAAEQHVGTTWTK